MFKWFFSSFMMMTAELIIKNQLKRIKKNSSSKNCEENTDLITNGVFNQRKIVQKTLYVKGISQFSSQRLKICSCVWTVYSFQVILQLNFASAWVKFWQNLLNLWELNGLPRNIFQFFWIIDKGWCDEFDSRLNIIILRQNSKSIWVIKLSFCQNDVLIGVSIW